MVAYSSAVIFVHLLLLSYGFLFASATGSVDGEREVIVEGRIFNITSGNDTFNLECGPECKRKVYKFLQKLMTLASSICKHYIALYNLSE